MKRETVIEEIEGGVAILTMNRPRQRNAFNNQMYDDLRDALRDAQENDAVRVVIVTGAPGAFSGGQDLGEMASPPAHATGEHGFGPFMDRLTQFDKPLLAAVNGVGVGIGLTLLLHCDLVYIAGDARLRAPFVSLGVVPEAASSYLLPALVGHPRAAELFYTNAWLDASRALELGIVQRICPGEELMAAIRAKASEIAAQPLGALRETRRLLLAARRDQVRAARERENETFARRIGSPENVEAVRAFFEKRPPDFAKT